MLLNTLRLRQNGCHFSEDIFKCIFFTENVWSLLKFSLKFIPKVPIDNIPALVQIMAWRRPGDKPLSEPVIFSLLMHICITRPQWVKDRVPGCSTNNGNQGDMPCYNIKFRADFRLVPSQWETSLPSNAVSHWLGTKLQSALILHTA